MDILTKNRTIRPSSRKEESSYKIDLEKRQENQDVQVIITHESDTDFRKEYYFSADQLKGKKSIHFYWKEGKILWENGFTPNQEK